MATSLEQELATYRRELPGFLQEHEREYVLIKGDQVAGFWKTIEEALEAEHDRFALEPFMVRPRRRRAYPACLRQSVNWGEEPFFDEGLTDLDGLWVVHGQDGDRHPPYGSPANQVRAVPAKMALPLVASWVEELGEVVRLRVKAGDVRPLVAVAVQAGEGEVVHDRGAAVLAGDHVVDGERDRGVESLGHPTVLAGVVGTPPHLLC